MSKPLSVSVVIPAYNASSFIGRGINSAISQSYPVKEIIVVDDGSSDDLGSVLSQFGGRVTLIRQQNSGASAARNKGVEQASGEYIAFLDADDYWHEKKLELQMSFLAENPDVDLCYCKCCSVDHSESDDFVFPADAELGNTRIIDEFTEVFIDPYFGTPGVVLKRCVFTELGGYDSTLKNAEDVDLWLRVSWCKKVAKMTQKLFVVVLRPGSLSTLGGGGFAANLQVIDKFCDEHPEFRDQHGELIKRAKSIVYAQWGRQMLADAKKKQARENFTKAMMLKPSWENLYMWFKCFF